MILSASTIECRRGGKMILPDVSFALTSGQIMAVTGANGSGKSTLLRVLAGLNAPAEGEILLNGRILDADQSRDHTIWIGPDTPLKPDLTVHDNLSFWMAMQGSAPDPTIILKALHRFEAAHLANRRVRTLSSGQKRRALMARLFLTPRGLWLLDEPESALDAQGRKELMAALHEHCGDRGAAIIATHQPDLWQPTFTLALQDQARPSSGFYRMPPSDTLQPKPVARLGTGAVAGAVLRRDLQLARRRQADSLQPVLLFMLLILLFPLSLGPDLQSLTPFSGGLLIMAALFAALLPLERIFAGDLADGTLETLLTTPAPLPAYTAGKMAAHWLGSGLPVVLATPLAALMLGVPLERAFDLAGIMLPVTLLFTMIGAGISALVLSAARGAVLLAILAAPLYIPVLIFGAAALGGAGGSMPFTLLWALCAALAPVSPLVAAGCLGLTKD